MQACRNLITFSKFSEIDYSILNPELRDLLTTLSGILDHSRVDGSSDDTFNFHIVWEFRSNAINWSARIFIQLLNKKSKKVNTVKPDIESLQTYVKTLIPELEKVISRPCCYFEMNGKVIMDGKFRGSWFDIRYHPRSFRQPDDTITLELINYFQKEMHQLDPRENNKRKTFYLFGGECVLMGKIIKKNGHDHNHNRNHKCVFYTDFPSIYEDCQVNHPDSLETGNVHLVDYKTCDLVAELNKEPGIAFMNTGYNGMGGNLANNLVKSGCELVYVISCNEKSFQNDFAILSGRYKIMDVMEIKTNYSVWIYKIVQMD